MASRIAVPPSFPTRHRAHVIWVAPPGRYTAQTDTECAITFTDLKAKSFPGMATAVLSPHTIDDEPVVPADRDPGALYQAHLFESSRFSALAIESAFALYDKRAFQLYVTLGHRCSLPRSTLSPPPPPSPS